MAQVSSEMLPQEVTTVTELMSYLCGVCMAVCVALAALPILNASARAALNEKVELVNEEVSVGEYINTVVEDGRKILLRTAKMKVTNLPAQCTIYKISQYKTL